MSESYKRSRPKMQNYGIHEGNEGLLEWSWVNEQMEKGRNYWVSTTRPDGRPHAAPVWGVWLNDTLYFGTARSSRKGRNLEQSAEIVVHSESGDETVIIEGTVEQVDDIDILTDIADAMAQKYPPYKPDPEPEPGTIMYQVVARVVFAWLEEDFPKTATRWDCV